MTANTNEFGAVSSPAEEEAFRELDKKLNGAEPDAPKNVESFTYAEHNLHVQTAYGNRSHSPAFKP